MRPKSESELRCSQKTMGSDGNRKKEIPGHTDAGDQDPALGDPLSLDRYAARRQPERTNEPFETRQTNAPRTSHGEFVVHQHAARSMHFDLRLEVGGVLLSFAVPKGPSLDPLVKRLAVQTESHPLSYLDFEDVIPEGNYGAGAMIAWDRGTVTYLEGTAQEGIARHKLDFVLTGYKLRGRFALIQTGHRAGGDVRHWLLVKKEDAYTSLEDLVATTPRSIYSGRSVEELSRSAAWDLRVQQQAEALGATREPIRAATTPPMLCCRPDDDQTETRHRLLEQEDFLYELKLDGVRLLGQKSGDHASLFFRSLRPAHPMFPEIAQALAKLRIENLALDGELVATGEDGRPDFGLLASRLHAPRNDLSGRRRNLGRLTYWVFDLLAVGPWSLQSVPLLQRKALLRQIVPHRGPISFLDHIPEHGDALYGFCEQQELEGVVAKRQGSIYQPGRRSPDWIKIKREREDDFVVVGWTLASSKDRKLGALELAAYRAGHLISFGRVGSGLSDNAIHALLSALSPAQRSEPAVEERSLEAAPNGRRYVEPQLVVTVRHQGLSSHGRLRFPVFMRIREDKMPHEVSMDSHRHRNNSLSIREASGPHAPARETPAAARSLPSARRRLTNQDKVFFPDDGVTKGDLCHYFETVSKTLLPYLKNRPAVLVRYPDGIEGKSFFQWRAPSGAPSWLRSVPLPGNPQKEDKTAFVLDSLDALLYVANLGCIPIHIFAHQTQNPAACQFATLDFDVGEGTFRSAVLLASNLLSLLREVNLPAFAKTSGQAGLHVHVGLGTETSFATAQTITELLARILFSRFPKEATLERRKSKRGARVLLDTGQVGPRRTVVAPYSPRAVRGACVATPLAPEELSPGLQPTRHTIHTVISRIAELGDPMEAMLHSEPDLLAAIRKLEAQFREGEPS